MSFGVCVCMHFNSNIHACDLSAACCKGEPRKMSGFKLTLRCSSTLSHRFVPVFLPDFFNSKKRPCAVFQTDKASIFECFQPTKTTVDLHFDSQYLTQCLRLLLVHRRGQNHLVIENGQPNWGAGSNENRVCREIVLKLQTSQTTFEMLGFFCFSSLSKHLTTKRIKAVNNS